MLSEHCHVTSGNGSEVFKSIESALRSTCFINSAHILTSATPEPTTNLDLVQFHKSSSAPETPLLEILSQLDYTDFDENNSAIYLSAVSDNASIELSNTSSLTLKNSILKIVVSESAFQKVPNLANVPNVVLKKIRESKIGHGSKQFVSYNYDITIQLRIANNQLAIFSELQYIIQTIFNVYTCLTVSTFNFPIQLISTESATAAISQINADLVNLHPLGASIQTLDSEDTAELYEYLTMLASGSSQLNTYNPVEDFISSYQVPQLPSDSQFPHNLERLTLKNIHSKFLNLYIREQPWTIISIHSDNKHSLLYRSPVDGHIILWEIK
ncbi:hypothetical protein G9P44_003114 [Scheffersomyces stipitis]|nr:hypothetical protein G9P44_003114 [Scheffersomyces stipitis]